MKPKRKRNVNFQSLRNYDSHLYDSLKIALPENDFLRWRKDLELYRNRVDDITVVWDRVREGFNFMRETQATRFDPTYFLKASPKELDEEWGVIWKLRVDIESYYIYADLLLDKYVALTKPVLYSRGVSSEIFTQAVFYSKRGFPLRQGYGGQAGGHVGGQVGGINPSAPLPSHPLPSHPLPSASLGISAPLRRNDKA